MKSYSETKRIGNLNEFDFKKKVSGLINETVNEFNNRYLEMNKNLMKFKNDFLVKMNNIQEIIDNSNSNYYQIKTEENFNKNIKNKILKKKNNNILKNLSFGINTSFNIYSSTNSTNNNNNNNNNVIYNNKKYNNLVNKHFDTKYNKNSIKYNFIKNINNSIEKHLKNPSKKKKCFVY